MNDKDKTKAQLIKELSELRRRVTGLEALVKEHGKSGKSREITKRKRAEVEARKFKTIADRAGYGIAISDLKGELLYVNRSFAKMHGYTSEELVSKNLSIFHNEEQINKVNRLIGKLMRAGSFAVAEVWHKRKDDTVFPTLMNGTLISDEKGPPLFMAVTAIDLTDRVHIEDSLREREERYRYIFQNAFVSLWEEDLSEVRSAIDNLKSRGVKDFRNYLDNHPEFIQQFIKLIKVLDVNDTTLRMYGAESKDELLGSLGKIATQESVSIFKEEIIAIAEGKRYIESEIIGRTINGDRLDLLINLSIPPEKEKYKNLLVSMMDITERKRMEIAIRESEKKYRTLFENSPVGIGFATSDGKLLEANDALLQMIGFTKKESDQINIKDIYHNTEDRELTMKQVRKEGFIRNDETRLKRKNGTLFNASLTLAFIKFEDREVLLTTVLDISKQKQLEEQLRIRQRMDYLGTLAGGIAHDFNNLLTGIMGYIDMLNLESDRLSETQKDYISNALISSQRAADLIRQLQTLSRGVVAKKASVDVYEIAAEVFGMLEKTTDRLINKEIKMGQGEYYVTADASELNQVFLNLGTNAVQSIEERGVKSGDYIRVSADEYMVDGVDITGLSEGEYVHIRFEDNGSGMSEEVKRKAFDPLFTTKGKGGRRGQGLGLAMVFNIVTKRFGGYIGAESEEGKGTVFHIYLPKGLPGEEAERVESVKGGNETVLIIEDEEQVSGLAESLLRRFGYRVLSAPDGEKGLEIYTKNSGAIDLVLLDLTMPRMSGQMVFKRMLKIDSDVKVIICSGQSDEDMTEGILSRVAGVLKKPYRVNELIRSVREVLD